MKYNLNTQEGFSLVETLVAITILLMVIVGPMKISSSTAKSTSFSSEQVVAFFLAQEGVELAQKARDDLLLKHFIDPLDVNYDANPWSTFVNTTSGGEYRNCFTEISSKGCGLELDDGDVNGALKTPVNCTSNGCALFYDSGGGRARYTYVNGPGFVTKPYTRTIAFEETVGGREVKVVSTVTWRTGSQRAVQEVEVETYLYNVYGL